MIARPFSRVFARRSVAVVSVVAALAAVSAPGAAMRHLRLVKSFPSADTTLAKSPDAIQLWLSEPTELPAAKIALANDAGVAIPTATITRGAEKNAPLSAAITTPLAAGGYKVTWKAMSKDGHVVNGTIAFKVSGK
jgi:methionine-rich copper-binding protein CopC